MELGGRARGLQLPPACAGHLGGPGLGAQPSASDPRGGRSIWSSRQLFPSLASPTAPDPVQAKARASAMWVSR